MATFGQLLDASLGGGGGGPGGRPVVVTHRAAGPDRREGSEVL